MTALQAVIVGFGLQSDLHVLDTPVGELFTAASATSPATRTKFFVAWSSNFPKVPKPSLKQFSSELSRVAWMNIHAVLEENWSNNQHRLVAAGTLANAINLRTEFLWRLQNGELSVA